MRPVKPKPIRLSGEPEKRAKFCSECGAPLRPSLRPRCGSPEFPDSFPLRRSARQEPL